MIFTPIAYFHSLFKTKFGTPRQSGIIADLEGQIIFNPGFTKDYVRGLDEFDYLWLIWGFSDNKHVTTGSTVRPPRLGGNKRMGVFATRSPYRPNPIGLSSVKIKSIDYCNNRLIITVLGADLIDKTPIFDIKPYVEFTDSHTGIRSGFVDTDKWNLLKVEFTDNAISDFNEQKRALIRKILEQDPRPHYQDQKDKIYGLAMDGTDIHFKIDGHLCTVYGLHEYRSSEHC